MGLETAFTNLCTQLQALQEALAGLHTTVVEDRPLRGDVVLVDLFGDAADDLLGWLAEAADAASDGRQAASHSVNLNQVRPALVTCQDRFNRIAHRFTSDVVCYERIDELMRFGRARGGEWRAWATSVKAALDTCQQPLFDVQQALFDSWQEFAERIGMHAMSVQTTSIGQQIRPGLSRSTL